ncbi:hypothetical protein NIES4071_01810 [Calothrix sp. NIES-4071]|nr:hypothetical protein NIES4071_01810 [Calothrix sp. NIES-4071]BAZ54527.1 hypothetical protein NIES4105_01800 [Calothrix sp. NIES-4105]
MRTQILCVLKLSLLLNSLLFVFPAMSEYKPPTTQKPPSDYTKSGGVRGCPEERIPLTILSPTTHIGQTASRRPTFAWYLYSAHNTEFRLFEFEQNGRPKQLGKPINLQASKGINKYSLLENYPELAIGKKYLWQISISCPDMPGASLIQRAEFTVVEMPSFKNKQPITQNSSQKANFYAQQGLWYDALSEALKLSKEGKLGEVGSTLVLSLAQSEEKAATSNQQELQQRIENLKMIANQEK